MKHTISTILMQLKLKNEQNILKIQFYKYLCSSLIKHLEAKALTDGRGDAPLCTTLATSHLKKRTYNYGLFLLEIFEHFLVGGWFSTGVVRFAHDRCWLLRWLVRVSDARSRVACNSFVTFKKAIISDFRLNLMQQAFKLQVLGVSVAKAAESPAGSSLSGRSYVLSLDVKAEKESSKTMSLGSWSFCEDREEKMDGLTYVATTPIRVRAFAKSLFTTDLGVHILYEHLHPHHDDAIASQGSLVFGSRRRGTAVVRIHYRLSRVCFQFQVSLSEVRCLSQSSWCPGAERVTAAVGSSSFDLGWFRALDSATQNEFKLTVLSRTEARFQVARNWQSGQDLGVIAFVPQDEDGGDPAVLVVKGLSSGVVVSSESGPSRTVVVTVTFARRFVFVFHVLSEPTEKDSFVEHELPVIQGTAENTSTLSIASACNVNVLIDGLQTFERYFDVLIQARHSICVLAWELSLSFGLITAERSGDRRPHTTAKDARWVSLEDVLLSKVVIFFWFCL
jgi:hypothetical protein